MLIPLVSVAVVLTLLPVLLASHRAPHRLAADPARGRGVAGLVGLGPGHRPAPLRSPPAVALVALGAAGRSRCSASRSGRPASTRWPPAAPRSTRCSSCGTAASATGVLTPIAVLVPEDQADAAVGGGARRRRGLHRGRRAARARGTTVVDVAARRARPSTPPAPTWSRRCGSPSRAPPTATVRIAGAGADGPGLLPRGLREASRTCCVIIAADHVPAAGAHLPVGAAAAEGGRAQPGVAGGRLRQRRVLLAGGPRLRARLRGRRPPGRSRSGCPW